MGVLLSKKREYVNCVTLLVPFENALFLLKSSFLLPDFDQTNQAYNNDELGRV